MISLCMICGNEEAVIIRCLESALPCFDELCLVRAIGVQEPDRTVEAAENFCDMHKITFRFSEYRNKIKMPHVDNFGAARQQSFDMATGDWCLWLDCDDYLDDVNARRIREAARISKKNAVFCGYQMDGKGGIIQRERLIRRGKGRWKNAIHETCQIDGESDGCPQIIVTHGDHRKKQQSSSERNARILEGVVSNIGRDAFYASHEFKQVGKNEESVKMAKAAMLLLADNQVEERYVVLINLSELEESKREEHLLEAARIQPHRREAFAYLCQAALIDGRLSDAVSWFRIMDALPAPSPLPWTHQNTWYAEGRDLLRVRLLRATGNDLAEQEHAKHMNNPAYAELAEAA